MTLAALYIINSYGLFGGAFLLHAAHNSKILLLSAYWLLAHYNI